MVTVSSTHWNDKHKIGGRNGHMGSHFANFTAFFNNALRNIGIRSVFIKLNPTQRLGATRSIFYVLYKICCLQFIYGNGNIFIFSGSNLVICYFDFGIRFFALLYCLSVFRDLNTRVRSKQMFGRPCVLQLVILWICICKDWFVFIFHTTLV